MRNIYTIHYGQNNSKKCRCGEMTVHQYEKFIKNPEETIEDLLLEFNDEVPDMNAEELEALMKNITSFGSGGKSSGDKLSIEDFHILKGIFMHNFPQPWSEFDRIPVREMLLLIQDLHIIKGQEEYDPNRRSERVDGEALMKMKKEIK